MKPLGGKLAQSYVRDAQIWTDKLVNGVGDFDWTSDEVLVQSNDQGDYELTPPTGEFQLVTLGGQKQDSAGNWIEASPMLAPAPGVGQTTTNITPLTTLVAFEPALKEKLAAYGDWNTDIASPSGVNGNLLRIAKTVETLSSVVSGGDSPLVDNLAANLRSLGVLAAQLNSPNTDLMDNESLKEIASSALKVIISDRSLVPEEKALSTAQQDQLVSSLEQAVEGITQAISASENVVENANLLAEIETVLDNASVAQTVSIKLSLGNSNNLNFGAVIDNITLYLSGSDLSLTAEVSDDDPGSLEYEWSTTSQSFSVTNSTQSTAQVSNFSISSSLQISLTIVDPEANHSDTVSCIWKQINPTICNF